MTNAKVIRYTTKPECADENARLVAAVFAELSETDPGGIHYATFRLEDGVSFVHVAIFDGDDNPLSNSPAFGEFQSGIADRCVDRPIPADASAVGSYRMFAHD